MLACRTHGLAILARPLWSRPHSRCQQGPHPEMDNASGGQRREQTLHCPQMRVETGPCRPGQSLSSAPGPLISIGAHGSSTSQGPSVYKMGGPLLLFLAVVVDPNSQDVEAGGFESSGGLLTKRTLSLYPVSRLSPRRKLPAGSNPQPLSLAIPNPRLG